MLKLLVGGFGVATVTAVAVPTIAIAVSPLFERRRGEVWRPVGALDDFPIDEVALAVVRLPREELTPTDTALQEKGVFVWRKSESPEDIVVYSRNCTDLSCPLTWDPGSRWFFCPCHGGIFTTEGDPVAGPPSRPMFRYATRVRDGVLEIDLNSLPPMT